MNNTKNPIGNRIMLARKEKFPTQEAFAKAMDVTRITINRYENLTDEDINIKILKKISKITNKPLSYFLHDIDDKRAADGNPLGCDRFLMDSHVKCVPVISWISANRFAESPSLLDESTTFVHTTGKGENMFALQVRNNCMEPEFLDGDIVIVRPDINAENGDYVVIMDRNSDEATFKQLKRYGRKVVLHPLNHKYPDIILDHDPRYEIIGVVVEKVKKYR